MEDIKLEKKIKISPTPISIRGIETILFQMKNCVCKIYKENGFNGSGFFCKIPYPDESTLLPVLITNNHVLDNEDIQINKRIILTLNDDSQQKVINIDKSRKKYTFEQLDTTIIEIKPQIDHINNFLDIDKQINKKVISFKKKSAYIIHYPNGENVNVSYGLLQNIENDEIKHQCNTEEGSSGSPILSLENFKVIGIHYGSSSLFEYNKGKFIKNILENINETINNNNYLSNNSNSIILNINNKKCISSDILSFKKSIDKSISLNYIQNDIINSCKLCKDILDEKGDKINGWSLNEKRGNKPYDPPLGWIGIGLKVKDKYDNGNNIWLGNINSPGEWCVAYYGISSKKEVKKSHSDCKDIYHPWKKVGNGVYCTPSIKHAESQVGITEINGRKLKLVFMVRVKPEAIRACNCNEGNEWVVNANTYEMRPYRILYKIIDN